MLQIRRAIWNKSYGDFNYGNWLNHVLCGKGANRGARNKIDAAVAPVGFVASMFFKTLVWADQVLCNFFSSLIWQLETNNLGFGYFEWLHWLSK